jgi:hypothetical protein
MRLNLGDFFCCYIKQHMATSLSQNIANNFYCNFCDYTCSKPSDYNKHILTRKHKTATISQQMATPHTQIIANNFHCNLCDYTCSKSSDYDKHLLTTKHRIATNSACLVAKNSTYICDCCNKEYVDRTGLWRHKKKCFNVLGEDNDKNNIKLSGCELNTEQLIKLLLKNQDIMENVILKNQHVMEKMIEIMPNIGNNSHNNTITNNTQNFNIQMFLNEHCKNAMNLTDFIDSLPITADTYDSTIENGLTKTITNMLVNGLSQLDILDRPIHCTDASRRTLYVKDDNIWEKDNELRHIMKGIKDLSLKQRTMINKWQDANMGWDTKENLQSRMTKLIFNSMTSIENDNKETGKIIRAISKNVYLDNDTRDQYIQLK